MALRVLNVLAAVIILQYDYSNQDTKLLFQIMALLQFALYNTAKIENTL